MRWGSGEWLCLCEGCALPRDGTKRPEEPKHARVTRRTFLAGIGASTAYVVAQGPRWTALMVPAGATPSSGTPSRVVTLLRREDMFRATFRLFDIAVSGSPSSIMTFAPNGSNPTIVVDLPSQAVGEQVFTDEPKKGVLARATIAGPSRLAFILTGTEAFTSEALLDWTHRSLRLTPDDRPTVIETAIEAPWGMLMSPTEALLTPARFIPSRPVTRRGITGLWVAELGRETIPTGRLSRDGARMTVVDIRKPPGNGNDPFPLPIDPPDRDRIFNATQNSTPVDVDTLVLSPLGAWIDLEGNWSGQVPGAASLTQWQHRSTMGRDQFVRIVKSGFLFPFGHRAVEIQVTERRLSADHRAYLHKRTFIVVKQREIAYDSSPAAERNQGRRWPFRRVRLDTLVTPDLADQPETITYGAPYKKDPEDDPYWVRDRSGKDVRFVVVATDRDGKEILFTAPLVFAKISKQNQGMTGKSITYFPGAWDKIVAYYNTLHTNETISKAKRGRAIVDLGGQKVAIAPSNPGGPPSPDDSGVAAYQATSMRLAAISTFADADIPMFLNVLAPNDIGGFRPELGTMDVRIDQIETMLGGAAKPATIKLNSAYISGGEADNPTGVFADLVEAVGVTFPGDRSGGLVTPNLSIAGLTRDLGPVGDVASFLGVDPTFDPKAYFPDVPSPEVALPKLLGGLSLADLLSSSGGTGAAPRYRTVAIHPGGDTNQPPVGFRTTMDWTPTLQDFGPFRKRTGASLEVRGEFLTRFDNPSASKSDVSGEMRNFSIVLGPIGIEFDKLRFESRNGAKPDVDLDIGDVGFVGGLQFLNGFADLMKESGLGGLAIDADARRVEATYTLGIPDMEIGVFALKNLSLTAGLAVPFKGDDPSTLTFDFATKDDPFLLTISLFAGSGYFGIELTPAGVRSLQVSLGFGAALSFNIPPVLYGSVSIQAGVLISVEEDTTVDPDTGEKHQIAKVGGFLSLKGEAEVGGVITVTISLYLTFEYISGGGRNKIRAEGVLTIEVDVVLFSASISKTVSYEFGEGADPTLAQTWTDDDWNDYVAAFNPPAA